jgi:cyclic beta-1,2-glucan synthetase
MYRAAVEYILGFNLQGERLRIDPRVPRFWRDFEITYRRGVTTYRIKVENPHSVSRGVATIELDGRTQSEGEVTLRDDGQVHEIRVVMGEKPAPTPDETGATKTAAAEEVSS